MSNNTKDVFGTWRKYFPLGEKPRDNSPTKEVELAVKYAQEDVCANICIATGIIVLLASEYTILGIAILLWGIGQLCEAIKWHISLNAERVRKILEKEDIENGRNESEP